MACSATLHHPDVKRFAAEVMFHPAWVDLKVRKTDHEKNGGEKRGNERRASDVRLRTWV